MTEQFVLKHKALVNKQAHRQHKQSNLFSVDDIEQEIWLKLASEWKRVKDLDEDQISYLAYQAAATYCAKQRNDYMYFTGNVLYSGEMVEKILAESAWADLEPGVDVEGRVDVLRAYRQISGAQQDALFRRFALKESTSPKLKSAAIERGIQSITNYLNNRIQMERIEMEDAAKNV